MWLKLVCLLVILSTLSTIEGRSLRKKRLVQNIRWLDCGTDPRRPVRVESINISPMPMPLPGSINISFSGNALRDMGNGELFLRITRLGTAWWVPDLPVPCVSNIGSCHYNDSCTLLQTMKNENWAGQARGIALQVEKVLGEAGFTDPSTALCTFNAGHAAVKNVKIELPALPSRIFNVVANGNYNVVATLREINTKQEIACVDLTMSVRGE